MESQEPFQVVLRCRPPTPGEKIQPDLLFTTEVDSLKKEIIITNLTENLDNNNPKTFKFSAVFDDNASQKQVYSESVFPLVESFLSGYNSAILAYGQTGSGKTYTMEGLPESEEHKGIIPRVFEHIFRSIESSSGKFHSVHVSYIMISSDRIRDLLSEAPNNNLRLREKPDIGLFIEALTLVPVKTLSEINEQFHLGRKTKTLTASQQNGNCCFAYCIFSITLESCEVRPDGTRNIISRKLDLVEMAGSERPRGSYLRNEALKIGMSLSSFGNVISALTDARCSYVPYRDSKFTRLMQNALGGNAMTLFIGNINPATQNYNETISTMRMCYRAQMVKNNPETKSETRNVPLGEFLDELKTLKSQIQEIYEGKLQVNPSFEDMKEFISNKYNSQEESNENKIS